MFKSARNKLTLYYIGILAAITVSLSAVVYVNATNVATHALQNQHVKIQRKYLEPPFYELTEVNDRPMTLVPSCGDVPNFIPETLSEIKEKTLLFLGAANLIVLSIAGLLAYYLAGITLKPIEDMVKKQKRFISDASHELKTPLTTMKTDLEVTLRDKHLDLEESKKVLQNTITEVDYLTNLTNKLLDQSRSQNGVGEKKELINLGEKILTLVGKMQPLFIGKKITVDTKLSELKLTTIPTDVETILTNLIDNAVKYSKDKGKVTISLTQEGELAVVTITDEGIGIPAEALPHIFEPFYRADESRNKDNYKGFGLGLSIVKDLIEKLSGTISYVSKEGEGTTVTVKLPKVVKE
jgi:signal transduction histidine kinase